MRTFLRTRDGPYRWSGASRIGIVSGISPGSAAARPKTLSTIEAFDPETLQFKLRSPMR